MKLHKGQYGDNGEVGIIIKSSHLVTLHFAARLLALHIDMGDLETLSKVKAIEIIRKGVWYHGEHISDEFWEPEYNALLPAIKDWLEKNFGEFFKKKHTLIQ